MLFKFVQATQSEREYLVALRKVTMLEHLQRAGLVLTDRQHSDRLNYKYDCFYMVFLNRELIGAVKYLATNKQVELIQLQIDPKYQGKGYGTGIVQQILTNEKGKIVKLTVLKENPAGELYKRLGFHIIGEDDHEYHMQYTH
jgi:ribosomal protein S18 acetylase RimI-like enzyme